MKERKKTEGNERDYWLNFVCFVSPYSGFKQIYLRTYINELTKGSFFYLFTLLSPSTRLMASTHTHNTHTLTVIKKEINIRIRIKRTSKVTRERGVFLFIKKNYHLFQFPTRVCEIARARSERVSGCCSGFGSVEIDIQLHTHTVSSPQNHTQHTIHTHEKKCNRLEVGRRNQ